MDLFDRSGAVQRPPLSVLARNIVDFFIPADRAAAARRVGAAPRGDGHPVLVFPAFLKGDGATRYLRNFLAQLGHDPHGWHQGVNIGPTDPALEGSKRRLLELRRRHGRKVSLVGHSLGGVIAREVAKQAPDSVRQVITLCSPFRPPIASNVELIYRFFARWHSTSVETLWRDVASAPPVPTTAIYSRDDGIVSWTSCV